MRQYFIVIILFIPATIFGQSIDSTAIQQVDSLIFLARDLMKQSDFENALKVNTEAEKIALSVDLGMGPKSSTYATCCLNHGTALHIKGEYPEAITWYLKAKSIREDLMETDHPEYGKTLNNLAIVYKTLGQYSEAEPIYLKTLEIKKQTVGNKHPDYAKTLNNLALLYADLGQYEKAESIYLEAQAIREETIGKDHPHYAEGLQNLAGLFWIQSRFKKVEPLLIQANEIFKKHLGVEHPTYAISIRTMADLYKHTGEYEKAESYYLEAIDILNKTLGKQHPQYSISLSTLASLYNKLGQYEKAKSLYAESIAITEQVYGKEHIRYASNLNGLAILLEKTGEYEQAESLYVESKTIWEKLVGRNTPEFAGSLVNLGGLYWKSGRYDHAMQYFIEAKDLFENHIKNTNHPYYPTCLDNLANLYSSLNQNQKAEPLFLKAISLREKIQGKENLSYLYNLINVALFYWKTNQYDKAESYFTDLSAFNVRHIEKGMYYLTEQELNNYIKVFSKTENHLLSFSQDAGSGKLAKTCYNSCLFYKGLLLQSSGRVKQLALSDSIISEKYYRLQAYLNQLATQYSKPIAERDSNIIAQIKDAATEIEKDLTRNVAGWDEANRRVYWEDVQMMLNADEVAFEFVQYNYLKNQTSDSIMYAALLLRPGYKQPQFIPLFEEKQLDSLLQSSGQRKADYVNNLYTMAERGVQPVEQPQKSLYDLTWQPLEQELVGVNTIYFSPAGLLHRLNLGAIPLSDEETLADRYRLIELGSTRQLVIPTKINIADQDALLYGGIQYDMDSSAIASANTDYTYDLAGTRGELSFSYSDSTNRGGSWDYLKWTNKEVDKVATTLTGSGFKTNVLKGYLATEESFKSIGRRKPSPRVLHIATHGFFFPDPKTDPKTEFTNAIQDEPSFKISEHPMIRSGLILAGGNYAWQTSKPFQPELEDGILTAYEISQINLSNTELVVLSACETGLGDIQGNEGVYGLQRAFKIAGAKYLIMSLWQVPDQETSIFMDAFYKHWIEGKMSIPDAFRSTQQEMKERFINPYQWAGFVLVE